MEPRNFLFEPLAGRRFVAHITAAVTGVLAGMLPALARAADLGLEILAHLPDGAPLQPGVRVLAVRGEAEQIARAEEELLGLVGKPSGVATAAHGLVTLAAGRVRIACGAWKKVAPEIRKPLREAIAIGGADMRLLDEPFLYLDKNFVRMFAGISAAVARARMLDGRVVAVQIRGECHRIDEEALLAVSGGAGVVMVDTGSAGDLRKVVEAARRHGFRERVKIAFAGGVTADTLEEAIAAGTDIVDIGRAIIDAPILDFRLDVQAGCD